MVVPRDNSPCLIIKDLPAKRIHRLAVLDGRIYAFVNNKNYRNNEQTETILFSCSFNGTERKINISTLRRKKQNFFDKQKPFKIANLFVDEKNKRLLFVCGAPIAGLWEFYVETGKHKSTLLSINQYLAYGVEEIKNLLLMVQNIMYGL